jgi:TfoX/Sxy family transcriptional regulator of competence genes
MACKIDFINYIMEQIEPVGDITAKKMFGEYMIYVNAKPIFLVCDDTAFVRKHDCIVDLLATAECGYPYQGAREHYILDVEDSDLMIAVATELEKIIPVPKKKKKKN